MTTNLQPQAQRPRSHQPSKPSAPKETGRKWFPPRKQLIYLLYAILALPLLILIGFVFFQPIQVLPRISLAPGFALTDQDGNRLTNEDLRGSLVLYNFTYTNCGEGCSQTSPSMAMIQRALSDLDTGGIPLQFVTISFDPARDTPEQLAQFAAEMGADTTTWHFLTGEPAKLKNVIGGGFNTFYEARDDGTFEFYPTFALVDGWGILRARYRTATPDINIVPRDIGLVVKELENATAANSFAYEAAHLFLCYPDY